MSCWRILIALLMLSQTVMAEEELTAEQVVQRWVKEQREHPVSHVKFSYIEIDKTFLHQTNRLGELTYTSETSGQYRLIPWPSTMKPLSIRNGYELRNSEPILNMSWNESNMFYNEADGTVRDVLPRPFRFLPWSDPVDSVEWALPPLFPGPVNEPRIARYNWSITKRQPNLIWVGGGLKDMKDKHKYPLSWEAIIDTVSWQVRSVRKFDSTHIHETVMMVIQD